MQINTVNADKLEVAEVAGKCWAANKIGDAPRAVGSLNKSDRIGSVLGVLDNGDVHDFGAQRFADE